MAIVESAHSTMAIQYLEQLPQGQKSLEQLPHGQNEFRAKSTNVIQSTFHIVRNFRAKSAGEIQSIVHNGNFSLEQIPQWSFRALSAGQFQRKVHKFHLEHFPQGTIMIQSKVHLVHIVRATSPKAIQSTFHKGQNEKKKLEQLPHMLFRALSTFLIQSTFRK